MKKIIIFTVACLAFLSAGAQITQKEADSIAIERMSEETGQYTIHVKQNLQTEFIITTANDEILELDYSCWIYYVNFFEQTNNNRYLAVKESNGNILEINTINSVHLGEDLASWKVIFPFDNIIDTLIGEWSWIKRYGGFSGTTIDNNFKSIVKILSQNEEDSINYEVFVEDTLFYRGSFQIQYDRWNRRLANIKLPHNIWTEDGQLILWDGNWIIDFGNRIMGISNENTLYFDEDADDGYIYHYQKINTGE